MKLTLPQKDIYFEQLLFPDEPIYNIGARISIKGRLNKEIFEQAYVALIQQHDAYRCFLHRDCDHVEMLFTNRIRSLEFLDFSDKNDKKKLVLEFMQQEFKKPFHIKRDEFLYRFVLIKLDEKSHYLFSVYHHIITDGWGTSLMFTRLVKNYNEILENGKISSEYSYSYESFVTENESYFNSEEFNSDRQYWRQNFNVLPENLFQKLNSSKIINISSRKELNIKRAVYNEITKLAIETRSSTFHIILAVLYAYLGKKSQNELISIGLPVLNRSGAKFKKTVGLFMGINPLLISVCGENTFIELVEKIKNQLKQDYRHQRFPLGELIKALGAFNEKEILFNITLSYEKQDYSSHFKDTVTKVVPLSHESERVALALYIREFDETEDVKIDFDYNLNYFTEESIGKVTEHFQTLMEEVLKNPNQILEDLDYLTLDERHELLYKFNDTKVNYPSTKTIIQLFEEQVEKTPENMAVWDSKTKITYRELKEKVDKVATYLLFNLGKSNESVGVLVERSSDSIVLLLGILKSGKCYIPIDPMLPKERIEYIINHSEVSSILTEEVYLEKFKSTKRLDNNNHKKKCFITKDKLLEFKVSQFIELDNTPKHYDTAYIIYTSGSTGNPKGVEIGHQALTNFLTSMQNKPEVRESDILYSVTTYSFDISILEFFTPLISGGSVFIANKEVLNNVEQLKEELKDINPTVIQATPSFYQMLFNAGWHGNKNLKILCGGDHLNESLAERLITHSKEVWNMYGPTETTIWSSIKKIEKPSDASNIGKPINNTQIYIVDRYHNLLPQSTIGRIFIAGDGLANGYYKNQTLTQEKFIKNPFSISDKNNPTMYETGDLGKWNEAGEIEFLGRNDFQVKVRGFRIELGEIEVKLLEYQLIKQVVADVREVNKEKILVAYYTKDNETYVDKTALREYLQDKLPKYMIPGLFVELESIPLSPNGKIDRKTLANFAIKDLIRKEYVAPRNDTEKKVVKIWQEVLGVDKIGVTDDFFELGGHSLAAGKIANIIFNEFNKKITLKQIFQNSVIEELTKVLEKETNIKYIIPKAEIKIYYPGTVDQTNIWIASQKEESSNAYNMYSVFEIEGNLDIKQLVKAINILIEENEIIRTNFKEKEGVIYQIIREYKNFEIDLFDLSDLSEENVLLSIKNYISVIFDLEKDQLIRVGVFECSKRKKYLVFLTHHIILDGISVEILLEKIILIYNSSIYVQEKSNSLQFKDYSEYLNKMTNTSEIDPWENDSNKRKNIEILGSDSTLGLTLQKIFYLPVDQYNELKAISRKSKTTLFASVLSGLNIVLSKIFDQKSICVGIVSNGRHSLQLEETIGMFIKTLPFKLIVNEVLNFTSLTKVSHDTLTMMEENISHPFKRNLNTLTDFLVVYQNSDTLSKESIEFGEFSLTKKDLHCTKSRFPVTFNFFETDGLKCHVDYSQNIDGAILEVIWKKLILLIKLISENPDQTIEEIDLTIEKEKYNKNLNISFNF